jgi:hypothetical protein
VIDHQAQALLQEVLRRESRSVLLYVGDAFPWTTARGEERLATLRRLVTDEGRAVAAFGQFLVRRKVDLPFLGNYPSGFTTINFLDLNFLLPRLVESERQSLADLERDRTAVPDAEARAELEKLAAVKRRTLAGLEELAARQPQEAGA